MTRHVNWPWTRVSTVTEKTKEDSMLDNDTITRDELNRALHHLGYRSLSANEVFGNVLANRLSEPEPTFTRAELERGLRAAVASYDGKYSKGLYLGYDKYKTIADLADTILANAREPEYAVGTVVRDANGKYWHSVSNHTQTRGWTMFGYSGTFDYNAPVRPLTVVSE